MSTTVSPVLLATNTEGVLTLTLNRPAVLNSLTSELLDALSSSLREAGEDDQVRAIVITGAGRGFCAGQDLAIAAAEGDIDIRGHLRRHYVPAIMAMREVEKPVIAAVNGVAAGAGLSLALAADMRIAAESATFVQAFVRIGLVPDAGGTFFLPRLVGTARAAELMMLGDSIDPESALFYGLINRVVPDKDLASATAEMASRLARGPKSVGLIKRVLNQSMSSDLLTQLGHEADAQVEAAASADFAEGVGAFLEKRPPVFRGR